MKMYATPSIQEINPLSGAKVSYVLGSLQVSRPCTPWPHRQWGISLSACMMGEVVIIRQLNSSLRIHAQPLTWYISAYRYPLASPGALRFTSHHATVVPLYTFMIYVRRYLVLEPWYKTNRCHGMMPPSRMYLSSVEICVITCCLQGPIYLSQVSSNGTNIAKLRS